jgi:hypothetical protein
MDVAHQTAADEFAVRYYRWALEDFRREIDADFPLIGPIKGSLAIRAVAYLRSPGLGDRHRVATALVKRVHTRAVDLMGDAWGVSERALADDFPSIMRTPRREDEGYRRARGEDPASVKVSPAQLLAAVKRELTPVLGSEGEPFSTKYEWRYTTPVGPWTLVTLVDVGGSTHQLAYQHSLRASERSCLKEGVSVLSWLGIGGGHTQWNQLRGSDIESAAASLAS